MSYKKFTKDIGIIGLTQLITALAGIIELPIITKLLGAENYGVWIELTITISLIVPIAILGLPYTLIRFLAGEKDNREIRDGIWSVLVIVFGVAAIISLFLILFSGSISQLFGIKKFFVQILALIIIFECLNQVFYNVFRTFQQIKTYSLFVIFQAMGSVGLIALTIFLGYGLPSAFLSLLIVDFISFIIMGSLIIKKIGIKIPQFLKMKKYLSFSLPTIMGNISFWAVQSSDRYLIFFFLGTIFVGYYSPAYTIGGIIMFFVAPLSFILPSVLAKSYDENKFDETKNYLKYSVKYFLLIAIPSFFGLSILSKQLLTIFSTAEIAQRSYFVVPIIALSMLPFGIYAIIGEIISLVKKTHISGVIWLSAALLNLILNFLFIPRFGILGAAVTTLLAYTFGSMLIWYYSYKNFKFEIDWQSIFKITTASVLMSIFVLWLNPVGFYKTIIAIIMGALIYLILIFLLKIFSKKEIEFFKKFPGFNHLSSSR